MKEKRVLNHPNLRKNIDSGAVVNVSLSEYNARKKTVRERKESAATIATLAKTVLALEARLRALEKKTPV